MNGGPFKRNHQTSKVLVSGSGELKKLTEPVAYEIILPSIHKQLDSVFKKCRNANFQVPHSLVQQILHVREVIAQVPLTFLSDVIVLQVKDTNK